MIHFFQLYIKLAYKLSEKLKFKYNSKFKKEIAITKLAHWYKDVEECGLNSFNTIKNTIQLNYIAIINYFENRSTNASAESSKSFLDQSQNVGRNLQIF